jgi:hypothetical protein
MQVVRAVYWQKPCKPVREVATLMDGNEVCMLMRRRGGLRKQTLLRSEFGWKTGCLASAVQRD